MSELYTKAGSKGKVEIDCVLRTPCTNNCQFCFQKEIGIDSINDEMTSEQIHEMANDTLEFFKTDKIQNAKEIKFKIMGGELFEIPFNDPRWEDYRYFFKTCINNAKQTNIKIQFHIVTNLLYPFEKIDYYFTFFKELNELMPGCISSLGTSFDIWGRFHTIERLNLWKKHFEYVLKKCQDLNMQFCIEMVLSSKSAEILKNTPSEYQPYLETFNYLYQLSKDKIIDFDLIRYLGIQEDNPLLLKDRDFADIYKWLLIHYPEFNTVKAFAIHEEPGCKGGMDGWSPITGKLTKNCCTLFPVAGSLNQDRTLPAEEALKKYLIGISTIEEAYDFNKIYRKHMNIKNCYMCKHFKYCKMDCMSYWVLRSSHTNPESSYCWMRDVYDFVDKEGLYASKVASK